MTPIDRRRFLQLALAAGGVVVLDACSSGSSSPKGATVLTTPRPADPAGPATRPSLRLASPDDGFPSPFSYSPGSYSLVLFVYDTLLLKDPEGVLQPWLASGYEPSADGLTHTFELRDARWHDGRPVTPDDVAFSFSYFKAHEADLPPTVLFRPSFVDAAVATGPRTVQVRLSKPSRPFAAEVAGRFPIVPKHVWEGVADPVGVTDLKMLVGSGPYRLASFDQKKSGYQFEANDDYFLGRPFVKKVGFHQVNDELIAVRAGDIDSASTPVGRPTRQALSAFGDQATYGILAGKPDFFAALSWNLSKPGPTSDVRFRRACAMAVDRAGLVTRLLGDGEVGNPGVLPADHPFHAKVEQYAFSVARANTMLDDAGYARKKGAAGPRRTPDGKDLRLTLLTFPEGAATAEILKLSLAEIGVELVFQPSDFFTAIAGGLMNNYEMALLFFGGVRRDPDSLRTMLASQTAGTGVFHALGWANAEFDDLAERQLVNLDDASRKAEVARMQELVAEELPFLVLYYSVPYYVYRRKVFDQWSADGEAKLSLVTGRAGGGVEIRPIAEG